ncbi:reverse transcriptase [Phytophthora megakarya]|uniref:Reverse transcriptase n=1 Tax=Phytophthora megakarya TaxID=4795 RepID=A0A225VK95_9STRA|nr:reverse transcriptase [Phytophthora megakarya]
MDHIPSLPRSYKGNTEFLNFEDLFSGYVIAKASGSRTAQTVAESYEECVFRPFGASAVIRHDREPRFMFDFFRAFNKILDQRQHWGEYAERLTFAINTAQDRIRGETPFYMVHGWDPRATPGGSDPDGKYKKTGSGSAEMAISDPETLPTGTRPGESTLTISDRADQNNDIVGFRVWLYLDRVRAGYVKKLAHLWHGPFRVAEKIGEYAVKLEIAGSAYNIFPVIHVAKIKPVIEFPDRPVIHLMTQGQDRLDFDEALFPGDSWIQDLDPDEYEVERISAMKTGRKTRYGRIFRGILVHWGDLNCGTILHEFLRDRANQNRFGVMQSHEES